MAIVKTAILGSAAVSDVSDARVWVPSLLELIEALDKRVYKLESEAPRAIVSRADPTTYHSHSQPKSWK
jgi:hypothetical protein